MRTFTLSLLLFGLLLVPSSTCLGQGSRKRPARAGRVKTPPAAKLGVRFPEPDNSVEVGEASITYLSRDDRTFVSTSFDLYDERRQRALGLDVGFVVAGRKVVRPDTVKFQLTTHAEDFRFRPAYSFSIKSDSEQFELSSVSRSRQQTGIGVENLMRGELSFTVFEKLAGGGKVQVLAGPFVFELSETQRRALLDMLSTVGMSSR
jgi:hypothetical protein